jgi:hypothetical protein
MGQERVVPEDLDPEEVERLAPEDLEGLAPEDLEGPAPELVEENMKTAPQTWKISQILKEVREESLIPRPEFQRRVVWTNKDKSAFIDTILKNLPFPEIYVASESVDTATGDAVDLLVDGQQRVRTIIDYFKGAKTLRLIGGIPSYENLSKAGQEGFLTYDVAVRHLGKVSLEVTQDIFQRINATSYDLNNFERFNADYLGAFKSFLENMSESEFFREHRIFSPADFRRMNDVSFVGTLTATILSDYFNRDEELENFLSNYNEEFELETVAAARFGSTLSLIADLQLDKKSRAFRKADFFSLFVEVDRVQNRDGAAIDAAKLARRLTKFYRKVDAFRQTPSNERDVAVYFEATLQSTNDRSRRIARGEIIRTIIEANAVPQ